LVVTAVRGIVEVPEDAEAAPVRVELVQRADAMAAPVIRRAVERAVRPQHHPGIEVKAGCGSVIKVLEDGEAAPIGFNLNTVPPLPTPPWRVTP